ncbi:MAG: tripartite tricarboxylate transporter substrate binding protein [Polaromonas sp.]|uniref:Bug family tripartite tricarboxylate transporter substrate binding protein n=1 Tax=Polaromonas sp. TaxID=1869339 RepID=UPI0025D7AA8E|nr:tripartite tricarboxylate transporter substrate-binding protein [Polaromonas sp.]MBI2728200.1 tripartite tricarboxylate transporter substrate binding protein [Polaromonas sp.]
MHGKIDNRLAKFFLAWLLAAATAAWHVPGAAQTYPDKPITIIVPYTAGTLADLFARTVGNELATTLKQPVIVDNRPGAGQVVGASVVARAAPNGYTLMVAAFPNIVPQSIQKTLPYKGNLDFAPVAHVATVANPLVVSMNVPANNLHDFIALLKANPGRYSYGSAGVGSPIHLFGEVFNVAAGTKSVHIPYKSFQTALIDIGSGQLDYGFMTFAAMQQVALGKMKVLGTPGAQRDPGYPQVPTLDEQGMKGFTAVINYVIMAPKATPPAIVEKLNAAINAATSSEAYASKVRAAGGVTVQKPMTSAQLAAMLSREEDRWQKVVKDQNITVE